MTLLCRKGISQYNFLRFFVICLVFCVDITSATAKEWQLTLSTGLITTMKFQIDLPDELLPFSKSGVDPRFNDELPGSVFVIPNDGHKQAKARLVFRLYSVSDSSYLDKNFVEEQIRFHLKVTSRKEVGLDGAAMAQCFVGEDRSTRSSVEWRQEIDKSFNVHQGILCHRIITYDNQEARLFVYFSFDKEDGDSMKPIFQEVLQATLSEIHFIE